MGAHKDSDPAHHVPDLLISMLQQVINVQHDLAKAVKEDDTMMPVQLWNDRIMGKCASESEAIGLDIIRGFMLQVFCRWFLRDCRNHLSTTHGVWSNSGSEPAKT